MNVPKPFNYSAINVSADTVIEANTYNVVYCQSSTPINVYLPPIEQTIDGFCVNIRNYDVGDVTVLTGEQTPLILEVVRQNQVLFMVLDKAEGSNIWRDVYGPTDSAGNGTVIGPNSSTVTAIARWADTNGNDLADSVVLVANNGDMTGINTITAQRMIATAGIALNNDAGSDLAFTSLMGSTAIRCVPPVAANNFVWTLPNVTDQFIGRHTVDTLTNKNIISTTNNVAANTLISGGTLIAVDGGSIPLIGQALIATSTSTATWSNIPMGVVGPATTSPNALVRWAGIDGHTAADSIVILNNNGDFTGIRDLTMSRNLVVNGSAQVLNTLGLVRDGSNSAVLRFDPAASGNNLINFPAAATGTDSVVYAATTATMTNKTITDPTNNVHAAGLLTATAAVITNVATAPTNGQVLTATSATTAEWQSPLMVEEATMTTTFDGPWSGENRDAELHFVKVGRQVTLNISRVYSADLIGTGDFSAWPPIPADMRPLMDDDGVSFPIFVFADDQRMATSININSTGSITIVRPAGSRFGWPYLHISYIA